MDSLDNLRRFLNRREIAAAPFFTTFPTDFATFLTAHVDLEVPERRGRGRHGKVRDEVRDEQKLWG